MDWSRSQIPPMRSEARFGDRVVPAFVDRPSSLWAMIAEAAARNGDGEALVCGDQRLSWRETMRRAQEIANGLTRLGLQRGDRVALLLGNLGTQLLLAKLANAQEAGIYAAFSAPIESRGQAVADRADTFLSAGCLTDYERG